MARKRGMQFIPYDYEAAYNKAMEDMHEWFIENLFQHRKKVIYALKEITAGDQFEIEIYPQFRSMDEVPPEGRTIKKDNNKAQKNLNDKNARKYVERLMFYIHARMRKRRLQSEKTEKTGKTCRTT